MFTTLFPIQGALLPLVDKPNDEDRKENHHRPEARGANLFERHCPRKKKGNFQVEQDEENGHQVVAHIEFHSCVFKGFEAFEDARMKFDVRYYLVAILFILFDLEIAFLFPWAVSLKEIGATGFWAMMVFLSILVVGFIYEWKKGALDWE